MTPELSRRIWFTLGALLVYRFGSYIPLPGIAPATWDQIFRSQAGGILGMFMSAPLYVSGASLLIVVCAILDMEEHVRAYASVTPGA